MLLRFLGCMIIAAIIEGILFYLIAKISERRFLKKTDAILMLYDTIYPMLADNFNDDNSLKVSVKFEYCNSKIKFRNANEAGLKFELLVRRALRNYYVCEYALNLLGIDFTITNLDECIKDLEEVCQEIIELRCENAKIESEDKKGP